MTSDTTPAWVLPTSIPFSELKAHDLEECVYWLFDAMGARDLEWRKGGSGGGAADGGRDLEATFYVPSPDGEMEAQRWWVECKGRSGTLENSAVQNTLNNATGSGNLACIVIVTNTTFSNPTRDWVKTWQANHPQPKVRLWDRITLERLLCHHPDVVLRLFSEALSTSGRLEALRERFWNRLEYIPVNTLREVWFERENLEIGPLERMALIANEFAQGNIEQRPWAGAAESQAVIDTFEIGLLNLRYLWFRVINLGVDESSLIRTFAYLVLATLQFLDAEQVAKRILKLVVEGDGRTLPDELVEMLLMPILDQLANEMAEVCSADCHRFFESEPRNQPRQEYSIANYWDRLEQEGAPVSDEPQQFIRLEQTTKPCKVGFELNHERSCPLYQMDPSAENIAEFLSMIKLVLEFRLGEARSNHT